MAHSVQEQLAEILEGYDKEVREAVEKDIEKVASETAKTLRQTSAKSPHGGEYAKNWSVRKDRQTKTTTVYNKKTYRLTHLLENGHVIRNQYGTYGRKEGDGKIKDAEQAAIKELVQKVEEDIERL